MLLEALYGIFLAVGSIVAVIVIFELLSIAFSGGRR